MLVGCAMVVPALAMGVLAYLAARRWPGPIESPHIAPAAVVEQGHRYPAAGRVLRNRTNPAEITGLALTVAIGVCILSAAGIGLLLAMVHSGSGLARWDTGLARFGADRATSGSTTFLRDVSQLGGTMGVAVIGLAVAVVEVRRTRTGAVVAFLLLALGGQFAIANLVKIMVNRDRPAVLHLTGFSGSSFPSGHATAAATTFMACALLLGRRRTNEKRAALAGLAVGLATAVAMSRVLLGVHWFTDVLAGLLLGWAWFALCSIAFGGRLLRFGATTRQAEAIVHGEHRTSQIK